MIEFKKFTLRDKDWVDAIVMAENSRSADFNFGNIYIWDKRYRQLAARLGDRLLVKLRYAGRPMFVFPIGSGPIRPAIEALRAYAEAQSTCFCLRGITEEHRALLEEEYPGCFSYEEDEDNADYIYLAEKLSTYAGKSLHSKKNHANRFEAENDWSFQPLTRELIPDCLDMLDLWEEENRERLDRSVVYEHDALIRCFAVYEYLNMDGGVLFANGRIVGFTVGELICGDTFDVHFEKAEGSINGAYPMVCREFTRMLMQKYPQLIYINREDDMGLASLRRSKESYRPAFKLKKYTAHWADSHAAAD